MSYDIINDGSKREKKKNQNLWCIFRTAEYGCVTGDYDNAAEYSSNTDSYADADPKTLHGVLKHEKENIHTNAATRSV